MAARVIAFDIAFSEPDENSQLGLINRFSETVVALALHAQALDWSSPTQRMRLRDKYKYVLDRPAVEPVSSG
jgi:hypothetical protein